MGKKKPITKTKQKVTNFLTFYRNNQKKKKKYEKMPNKITKKKFF